MKDKQYKRIAGLIELFLDGGTTPAQEHELYAFFSHTDIPEHLQAYQPMFAWYDALPKQEAHNGHRRRKLWWAVAGAAAVAALVVSIGVSLVSPRTAVDSELYAQYRGSYIVRDGKRITDLSVIYPTLARAEASADSIEAVLAAQDRDPEEMIIDQVISSITDPDIAAQLRSEILGKDI